jgi:hypothetical protein
MDCSVIGIENIYGDTTFGKVKESFWVKKLTRCPNVYEGWCEYLEGRLCMLKLKVLCRTAFVGYT